MTDTTTMLPDHRYRFETGGCPIEAALDTLSGRWKGLLLFRIYGRATRFHELRKELQHVSQRMLVRQLRELERDGLIRRSVTVGVLAKVEYSLTDAAQEVMPLLIGLRDWGARHVMGMSEKTLNARLEPYQNACPIPNGHRLPSRR